MAKNNSRRTASGTSSTVASAAPLGSEIDRLHSTSPRRAAEKAVREFIRPPRVPPNSRQRLLLSAAERSSVQVDGNQIIFYSWSKAAAPSPTVLLSHGFGTNAASMLNFVPPLLAAGFRVVAWDQVAQGESGGDWADLRVFMHTIQTFGRQHAPLGGIIGHSVGAAMAMMALAEDPLIVCPRLVCLSPPTQVDRTLARYLQGIGCTVDLGSQMLQVMAETNILSPAHLQTILQTHQIHARVLFVLDRDDTMVPATEADYLVGAVPNSAIKITQGNGHYKALSDPKVIRIATDFVIDTSASPSTGISKL